MSKHIKEEIYININDAFKIKPTKKGWEIYWEYMNDWRIPKIHGIMSMSELKKEADDKGYLRLQAWKIMEIFGPHINLGGDLLFHAEMKVKV